MQPQLKTKHFLLVGVESEIDLGADFSGSIEGLMNALRQSLQGIPHAVKPARMIGFWYPEFENGAAEVEPRTMFFVGVEVISLDGVPDSLITKELPNSLFAVFSEEQRGTVGGPEGYAYRQWLPTSGCLLNADLPGDLEVYDDMEHTGYDDRCEIFIPIRTR